MKQRFFPLALLISSSADALLLQQGYMQFELDPATLHIAAGPVPSNLAPPAQQVTNRHNAPAGDGRNA